MKIGKVTIHDGPTIGAADPDEEPERWLRSKAAIAAECSIGAKWSASEAIEAARALQARPDLWGGRDWPTLCREVIREDDPGWLDFLLEHEADVRGLSHAEARALRAAQVAREAKPARTPDEVREVCSEAGKKGGRGRKGREHVTGVSPPDRGNRSDYLASRLKRDAPAIAERLASGEFPSVRAAALEAGIVRAPTALDLLRRAWRKASPEERRAFANEEGRALAELLTQGEEAS